MNGLCLSRGHAVGIALVGFECAFLNDFAGDWIPIGTRA
jgi:hypothetical protein